MSKLLLLCGFAKSVENVINTQLTYYSLLYIVKHNLSGIYLLTHMIHRPLPTRDYNDCFCPCVL